MRKLLLALLILSSLLSEAQIKITAMPTYLGDGDSAWVPVVIGNTNRKMYGRDLSRALFASFQSSIDGKMDAIGDTLNLGGLLLYKNADSRFSFSQGIEVSTVRTAGIANNSDVNNSQINPTAVGALISRSVADANTVLRVNQANNSASGPIAKFQFGSSDKAVIDKDGNLTLSGSISTSSISSTEFGYLDGLTYNIQEQLDERVFIPDFAAVMGYKADLAGGVVPVIQLPDSIVYDSQLLDKADISHTHSAADITSGTLNESRMPSLGTYASASGTVSGSDSYKQAIQKLDGNILAMLSTVPRRIIYSTTDLSESAAANVEQEIFRDTIYAGTMGVNSMLTIELLQQGTGAGGDKNCFIKLNGTTVAQPALTGTQLSGRYLYHLTNRGVLNSQIAGGTGEATPSVAFGEGSGSTATQSIDFSGDVILTISQRVVSGTDALVMRNLNVMVYP